MTRIMELEALLREVVALDPRGEFLGWQLDAKIDAALGAEKVSTPCGHEWIDDGEFTLVCTACGAKEDYTQALQCAFELGGTDDGAYHLEAEELCEVLRLHTNQLRY